MTVIGDCCVADNRRTLQTTIAWLSLARLPQLTPSCFSPSDLSRPRAGAADPGTAHPLHPQRGGLPLDRPDEAAASTLVSLLHPRPTRGCVCPSLITLSLCLRDTSPPAPSMWFPAPTAAPSSWRAATCPTTCSTTAPSARWSASSVVASSPARPTR